MQQIEINLLQFYTSVSKRPKTFAISVVAIIAFCIYYSFTLPIEFNSKVIFYPLKEQESDPKLFEKVSLNEILDNGEKYMAYGGSRFIKDAVAQKFNLIKRYKIDSTLEIDKSKEQLYRTFDKNVVFKKVANGGVEISVFDSNKDTVALIANEVASLINSHFASVIQKRNILIKESQIKRLAFIKTNMDELKSQLQEKEIKQKTLIFSEISQKLKLEIQNYALQKLKCDQFDVFVSTEINTIEILEPAQTALRKAKPMRSIIVIIGTFVGVLFWISGFTLYDNFKK